MLVRFTHHYHVAIDKLQTRNTPTFRMIIPTVFKLYQSLLEEYLSDENEDLYKKLCLDGVKTLERYISGDGLQARITPLMAAVNFFDPATHKLEVMEKGIRKLIHSKFQSDETRPDVLKSILKVLKKRRARFEETAVDYIRIGPFTPRRPLTSSPPIFTANGAASSEAEVDEEEAEASDQVGKEIQIFHQVSKRIREAPIELMKEEEQKYAKSNKTPTDFDIFWWDKRNELPILSKTLLNLTTIPSSTAAVETSFLFQQLFHTSERNRLSPAHLNDLITIYFDQKFC